jgi:flagellar biosynthesis protein FlhA
MSTATKSAGSGAQSFGGRNKDIGFALGMIWILAMLFVPLPPIMLDLGLALSLSFSILILMVALWIPKPLEFNSFPTLLLVVTMLRLSLNIASTRLILAQGHTGTDAAGGVIEGFSRFIVGGNYVIGIVIFVILVVINFMVISKGSTRIAEVSARFSLDAMPGKQMAIDADLGAGLIDEEQAKSRRKELEDESSFFGAMDGASKFVRGDAVAGIIITIINVVGGIIIGVVQHQLSVGEAANNYTVLTIGDGLVSQIPALVVSLAAGLIVTKGGTEGAANEAVIHQLGKHPRAMYMAAGLLGAMGLLPGFPISIFLTIAIGLAVTAYVVAKKVKEAEMREVADQEEDDLNTAYSEETPKDLLTIDDLRLELGSGLVKLISSMDAALPGKVRSLRKLFAKEFGFLLPFVRIKDEANLDSNEYAIVVHGVKVAKGEVRPNSMLVINPANESIGVPGERTQEPTFGLPAIWIDPARTEDVERLGFTVVDPESVITTHITEVLKEHMPELLTYGATQELIEGLDRRYQKLVKDIGQGSPEVLMQRVLQNLLRERVSIRNLPLIVEAVTEASAQTSNMVTITEHVRQRLASQICQGLTDEAGYVPVVVMSANWENEFLEAVKVNGDDRSFIMSPQRVQEFVLEARKTLHEFAERDEWPAILVNPECRTFVHSMMERVSPMTQVISHNELHRKVPLKTVATIGS